MLKLLISELSSILDPYLGAFGRLSVWIVETLVIERLQSFAHLQQIVPHDGVGWIQLSKVFIPNPVSLISRLLAAIFLPPIFILTHHVLVEWKCLFWYVSLLDLEWLLNLFCLHDYLLFSPLPNIVSGVIQRVLLFIEMIFIEALVLFGVDWVFSLDSDTRLRLKSTLIKWRIQQRSVMKRSSRIGHRILGGYLLLNYLDWLFDQWARWSGCWPFSIRLRCFAWAFLLFVVALYWKF